MARAPRLFAFRGASKVTGQVALVLVSIVHLEDSLIFAANLFLEEVPHFPADQEDDPGKTGPLSVVDGIVHEGFAARTHGVELLESAVARAHAGGENEKGWLVRSHFEWQRTGNRAGRLRRPLPAHVDGRAPRRPGHAKERPAKRRLECRRSFWQAGRLECR